MQRLLLALLAVTGLAALTFEAAQAASPLVVTNTFQPSSANVGDTVHEFVTVHNGTGMARSITVHLVPSAETLGLTFAGSNGVYANGTWNVGTVANGGDATLDITYTVPPNTCGNTYRVSANATDGQEGDTSNTAVGSVTINCNPTPSPSPSPSSPTTIVVQPAPVTVVQQPATTTTTTSNGTTVLANTGYTG